MVARRKIKITEPQVNCQKCPRLAQFRASNKLVQPKWHNGAVPAFGSLEAKLLIVGLAPGLKGANRTGRPFTGDYAGDLLYPACQKAGLACGEYQRLETDTLELIDCRITNAVRCVPPKNKPTLSEINVCNEFLRNEINAMNSVKVILALGHVAHNSVLRALNIKLSHYKFQHGAFHSISKPFVLANSYHCSRYNTNTGRLTKEMFDEVLLNVCLTIAQSK